jgi:O-methyltransferase
MLDLKGITERTLLDEKRLQILGGLCQLLDERNVPGCIVEVGVYRGGSAKYLAQMNPSRAIHIFDTFAGIPYGPGENDQHNRGDFPADFEDVSAFLSDCPNVRIYSGIFPETMPKDFGPVALAHIDVDMEKSARDCINELWPLVSLNGYMVFDDYASESCQGVKKIVDRFLGGIISVDAPPQGWVKKIRRSL